MGKDKVGEITIKILAWLVLFPLHLFATLVEFLFKVVSIPSDVMDVVNVSYDEVQKHN